MKLEKDISKWIQRNMLLRPKRSESIYNLKKQSFLQLFNMALDNRSIPARPYVYDSHQAEIRQMPSLNAIICDIHFWDVAWLIASSFYIHPTHDIKRLANLLIADSLLYHGNPLLSLDYAHKFIDGPHVAAFSAVAHKDLNERIGASVEFQIVFAMGHEISHYLCDDADNIMAVLYKSLLNGIIEDHNSVAEIINSVDLTPIRQYLDAIEIKSALDFPSPSNATEIAWNATIELWKIVEQYGDLVALPDMKPEEKKEMLFYACDNYVRGVKSNILSKNEIIVEGTCDLLALSDLFESRVVGQTTEECNKIAIEAYVLTLLALDMIHGAMNIYKYSGKSGYEYVDTLYMRRELEKHVVPFVIDYMGMSNKSELLDCYDSACEMADLMYAEFCDYAFSNDYTCTKKIPHGSKEWQSIYYEVNRLLQLPV